MDQIAVTHSWRPRRRGISGALFLAAFVAACGGGADAPAEEAEAAPEAEVAAEPTMSVRIVQPVDGAALASPVRIVMEVEGLEIVPAGEDIPRSGHHHLLINQEVPEAGVPIPSIDGYVHMGQAQTEIDLELPPGEHTIIAVVGDFAHRVLDPSVEDTIRITVN